MLWDVQNTVDIIQNKMLHLYIHSSHNHMINFRVMVGLVPRNIGHKTVIYPETLVHFTEPYTHTQTLTHSFSPG